MHDHVRRSVAFGALEKIASSALIQRVREFPVWVASRHSVTALNRAPGSIGNGATILGYYTAPTTEFANVSYGWIAAYAFWKRQAA